MKKALLLTDGSVNMALSLNRWLEDQSESIDLTVVCAFSLTQASDQPLTGATYGKDRQIARDGLNHWLNFLPQTKPGLSGLGQLQAEVLLGKPELVLSLYLLLRRYDYWLFTGCQKELIATLDSYQPQITAQFHCLTLSGESLNPYRWLHENEPDLAFIQAAGQLAA